MNDPQNRIISQIVTADLINNTKQSIKITARSGGYSLLLVGLGEKNNPFTFAS